MAKEIQRTIENDMGLVDPLVDEMGEWLDKQGASKKSVYAIRLSVEELATNIIKYGYPEDSVHSIDIKVAIVGEEIILEMWDDSDAFDSSAVEDPDVTSSISERALGGLGVHLVKKMTKSFECKRENGKNHTIVVVAF